MRQAGPASLHLSVPLRVFLIGCVLSGLAAVGLDAWLRLATARRVDDEAANLESKIDARVAAYLALLRGTAGFFGGDGWISHDRFRRYFQQIEVDQNYPGVQGVGVSLRLEPDGVPDLVRRVRRDEWPAFRVWPEGDRPVYHTILYLEPEDKRNLAAIGYDMHTDPTRRAAMDRARDSGNAAVTGKVTLVQEIDRAKQPGFLIYFPFYAGGARPATVEDRRRELAGFAYAAFRAGDFMNALVEPAGIHNISVSLYDSAREFAPELIFTMDAAAAGANGRMTVAQTRTIRVFDRRWTLVCSAQPRALISPYAAGILGILVSGAVAFLFRGVERERNRAEESEAATRERESELALLVDAVPALVAYIDRDECIRLCNRQYQEWFALDPSSLVGRRVADVAGPGLYKVIRPHLQKALSGEGTTFERWYGVPGVGSRYLSTMYLPHRAAGGEIHGVYALVSDLTRHKRAEDVAQFMADCGRLLIASMDIEATSRGLVHLAVPRIADVAVLFRVEAGALRADAVAHVDDDAERRLGQFLDRVRLPVSAPHNIGLAARTGTVVVSTELNSDDLERAAEDEPQRQMLRALELRSALHVPVVVRDQIWAVFSFGTAVASGRQFTDEHRQLAEEISTRVRLAAENALLYREAKQTEEELERRVELRTAELNDAIHELEAFSYSVSHDLRAPLRTIRGFTELTLEEAQPRLKDEERDYLERVRRASVRLERLITDLLAYTRVSKTKVELRPVDLHALVSDIQREHPEFQPPQAEVLIEGRLLPAIGNEAYLTQCITNLLGNAVKFVGEGKRPLVRIWTERRAGMVRLSVGDNGIGIAPELQTRAFEMFERLHTSGSYEGTGVGLAIVRRAVQRMKGSVGLESTPGEGTTFWIELRAAD
jgi:PAS domain S-box-containing protein